MPPFAARVRACRVRPRTTADLLSSTGRRCQSCAQLVREPGRISHEDLEVARLPGQAARRRRTTPLPPPSLPATAAAAAGFPDELSVPGWVPRQPVMLAGASPGEPRRTTPGAPTRKLRREPAPGPPWPSSCSSPSTAAGTGPAQLLGAVGQRARGRAQVGTATRCPETPVGTGSATPPNSPGPAVTPPDEWPPSTPRSEGTRRSWNTAGYQYGSRRRTADGDGGTRALDVPAHDGPVYGHALPERMRSAADVMDEAMRRPS
jgi:hypothetical protein